MLSKLFLYSLRWAARVLIQNDRIVLTYPEEIINLLAKSPPTRLNLSFINVIKIWSETGILYFLSAKGLITRIRVRKSSFFIPVYRLFVIANNLWCLVLWRFCLTAAWYLVKRSILVVIVVNQTPIRSKNLQCQKACKLPIQNIWHAINLSNN